MRLRLNLMPGFTLATSLTDLAVMAVRALISEPLWPTSARARADESERGPIATAIRSKAPIAEEPHCPLSFAGAHLRWNPSGYRRVADHGRQPLNDQVSYCLLYDGPGPDSRLIGVEYLVSDEVYRRMPDEERLYWHPRRCEDDAGLLARPTQSRFAETGNRAEACNLWAKVYHTWVSGGDYPSGPTRPLWSDTGELPLVLPPGAEAQLGIR